MAGAMLLYNVMIKIFEDVDINPDTVQKDPKTRLAELFSMMSWTAPRYKQEQSNLADRGPLMVRILGNNMELLGIGYGKQAEAEAQAAEHALKTLAQKGITRERAEERMRRQREENDPKFNDQLAVMNRAIGRYNEKAKQRRENPIEGHRFSTPVRRRGVSGPVFTVNLEIGYLEPLSKTVIWREMTTATRPTVREAQTETMNMFTKQLERTQ